MQSLVATKTQVPLQQIDASKTQNAHAIAMCALTSEEILLVAGGPEVDVSAGGGGG